MLNYATIPRMISFFVKNDKMECFEKKFNEIFKGKYVLYNKKDFFDSNIRGYGKKHYKIDDFIGDYIVIAISDSIIVLENYYDRQLKKRMRKSQHTVV